MSNKSLSFVPSVADVKAGFFAASLQVNDSGNAIPPGDTSPCV
jgi:hypothetical protein